MDGQTAAGWRPYPAEFVAAPKSDRSARPAADLAIEDHILFAAIVDALRSRIPQGFVDFSDDDVTYDEFERFPLRQTGVRYVVEGDAASFFQLIDYQRLTVELIGLTGWADAVEPLVRLLEGWMGGENGLPQGPASSRVLADIYIAPAARRLARAGWTFSRYSDDFRIVARSWRQAREAHYALEAALWERRLIPASNKARIWKKSTYRRRVETSGVDRLATEASREVFEQAAQREYTGGPGKRISVTVFDVLRAELVLNEQIGIARVDSVGTRLIRDCLLVLGSGGSPAALPHMDRLLGRYAHLTQSVANYLQLLMGSNSESRAIATAVDWMRGTQLKLPWQVGWLLNAMLFADGHDERLGRVAAQVFGDPAYPWFVQGQAALCLASHGKLPALGAFVSMYELSPPATRPDLVAAVTIGSPRWSREFLTGATSSGLLAAVLALDVDARSEWL